MERETGKTKRRHLNQMPPFANVLTPDQIADLARFVLAEAKR